ncbi:MAG: hypothetical protein WBB82_06225 [Limnothrix sp.]
MSSPTHSPIPFKLIVIQGWQPLTHKALNVAGTRNIISGTFQGGIEQVLTNDQQLLSIQRAELAQTNGDLKTYVKTHTTDLFSNLKYDDKIGHYSQFLTGDRLTMMACITQTGQSTVTADQFKIQQIKATFSPAQFGGWLLNKRPLVPNICHWRSLSIQPVKENSPALLYDIWQEIDQN